MPDCLSYGDMAYVLSFPGFKGCSSTCSNTFLYLHSYYIHIIDDYISKTMSFWYIMLC